MDERKYFIEDKELVLGIVKEKVAELRLERGLIKKHIDGIYNRLITYTSKNKKEWALALIEMYEEEVSEIDKQIRRWERLIAKPSKKFVDLDKIKADILISDIMPGKGIVIGRDRDKYLCPLHSEKTPSFVVFKKDNRFYCFGCHEGGDVIALYMKINGCSFKEAVHALSCG